MPSKSTGIAGSVAIVSDNADTLDGLQQYLAAAGVACRSTRVLDDAGAKPGVASVLILFPDDFPPGQVLEMLRTLRQTRPRVLTLLVTREPGRFREAAAPDGRSRPPIVLPKPVFGWAILDAIRVCSTDKASP